MKAEELKEKLMRNKKTGWVGLQEEEKNKIFSYCEQYMQFMNNSKTEREVVKNAKTLAEQKGFQDISTKQTLQPGDRIYWDNRGKSIYLAIIGKEAIENGVKIVGAHADSPRLDLKPNPLYEEEGLAYFKTHYYGGIKKYQWTTIP